MGSFFKSTGHLLYTIFIQILDRNVEEDLEGRLTLNS